ncbi:hypothetical protein FVW20_05295 [Desulfovibrio oxamicus]|jgi:ferritin-like metal-binding protein YciE|uniref:Uncharacterized protein n=1 Tax=Nitratidesulfovibrio oxamicus TaxID=32016 RepID=A0ABS0J1Z8_9BACT|nr:MULTISPECIES: hypothetical protein [Nitratidesulfovibrio]MBG3876459.1 hypothetical protein [Nitratidesulfovibrio oxamicus]NHZ48645.1 hypothetical protein [Nitratidesulfovibrio liaohensis]
MSKQSYAHEAVAWAKQRLDDVDAIILEVEKATGRLADNARKEAGAALARLKESRAKQQKYYDELRAEVHAVAGGVEKIQDALETEWVEVEAAFQAFLSASKDHAETMRDVVVARAQAQRRSWEASLKSLREQADDVVETARGELDAAIKHLSYAAEKFQTRISEAKDAGDESWTAVRNGLSQAKAVHDRTIQKIKNAFSRLL